MSINKECMDHRAIRRREMNKPGPEVQVYLTEYSCLRQEVISCLETQRQLLSLELAVIGVAVSGVTFMQAQPILYLFGALLLGLLSWIMFEQTLKVQMFYEYFEKVLATHIKKLIPNGMQLPILGWQSIWFSVSLRTIFYGVLSWAKFLLGVLLASSFCILFWLYKRENSLYYRFWTSEEKILFLADISILLLPLLIGLISVSGLIRKPSIRTQISLRRPWLKKQSQ